MSSSHLVDPLESTWPRPMVRPLPVPDESPALSVLVHGLTDKGRERSSNEDRFLIASPASALWMARAGAHASDLGYSEIAGDVFAVADGIGGHAGGAQASALAIETMGTFLVSTLKWVFAIGGPESLGVEMLDQLEAVLRWADSRVREEAARNPALREMGSTLTMTYRYGAFLHVAHVGDSRCYLLRDGALHQITHDHTVVAEMVRHGILAPELAAHHAARHVITNALGGITPGLHAEVHRVRIRPHDVLLLCTDGLTEMVTDDEIRAVLEDAATPRSACEDLVMLANDHGGYDNITALVARYEPDPGPPPLAS